MARRQRAAVKAARAGQHVVARVVFGDRSGRRRVVECACGESLEGRTDEDLAQAFAQHVNEGVRNALAAASSEGSRRESL